MNRDQAVRHLLGQGLGIDIDEYLTPTDDPDWGRLREDYAYSGGACALLCLARSLYEGDLSSVLSLDETNYGLLLDAMQILRRGVLAA